MKERLLSEIGCFNIKESSLFSEDKAEYKIGIEDEISKDPFDALKNNIHVKKAQSKIEDKKVAEKADDEIFLEILKKPKIVKKIAKPARKVGIFRKIQILSKSEIDLSPKKYYKFPFDGSIKNDGSLLFLSILNQFSHSMASAYSNYRRFGESFMVQYGAEIFYFNKKVSTTKGIEKMLKISDISYVDGTDYLEIEDGDKGLVYDMLLNLDIPKGSPMPFILSEYEFENAIIFRTRIEKGPSVRVGPHIEHLYTIHGPLHSSDYNIKEDVEIFYHC